jgi:hypothetical protein
MGLMLVRRLVFVLVGLMVLVFPGGALGAGDADVASCANESLSGFESYLPDCRAYEMVTPSYKGGAEVKPYLQTIAVDGDRLIGTSFGGFAGTENDEDNLSLTGAGMYEFSRTPSGWVTEALAPPAQQVAHSEYVTASADLDLTLWELGEQAQAGEEQLVEHRTQPYVLAVREQGGRFVEVGPEDSPATNSSGVDKGQNFILEGASPDLTHVVFSVNPRVGGRWPGDTSTGSASLYEYVGTGNQEPDLVGVRNVGSLQGTSHVNEHAELISECGTELGGGDRGSSYNALTQDGADVFFTALHESCGEPTVNELYERVDGSKTVAVSEPALSAAREAECTGVCREDENEENGHVRSEGVFQGASQDGSKVFFTTEQPLLNNDRDTGNDLYEAELGESGVQRLTMVSEGDSSDPTCGSGADVLGVSRISEDGSRVYFVAQGVLTEAPNGQGEKAEAGANNLYVVDTASRETSFIGQLSGEDEEDWRSEDQRPVQTTSDGRFLLFLSTRDLTGPEDTSMVSQAFEYDAQKRTLVRVSAGQRSAAFPAGFNDNGNVIGTDEEDAAIVLRPRFDYDEPHQAADGLALTEDGSVFFASRVALTPAAVAGSQNVYEYHGNNVYLISPGGEPVLDSVVFGEGPETVSRFLGADASGADAFVQAIEGPLAQPGDTEPGWFDVRANGGFGQTASVAGCVGDACQGSLSAGLSVAAAGTATAVAEGDLAAPAVVSKPKTKPKPKSKVKVKVKKGSKKGKARRKPKASKRSVRGKSGRLSIKGRTR